MSYAVKYEIKLFCPKCQGQKIKIRPVEVATELISMDDYPDWQKRNSCVVRTDMIRYYRNRLVCTLCGYTVEFVSDS